MMVKTVDKRWLEYRAKTIATKNLKNHGRSLAWISILERLRLCVICVYLEDGSMDIDYDEYKRLRDQGVLKV